MDGYVQIATKLDTKDFDAEINYVESQLDEIEYKLKQADMGFEVGDTQKLEAQYSRLIKQLDKLQKKQADLNKTNLTDVQKNIDKVGNSVNKTISKVGKWALAVFGVRSAYMFVRQSASTLSQYNEQIASDLEYMQFALASMLQPIVEGLIQLVYKLLTYVNYIAQAWFGVNLFANASAKAMDKGSKSAEKMKKSLTGFDEINVLNDNGTTGSTSPSMDLSAPEDVPIPSWLQWIVDNKDIVIATLLGIGGALLAMNLSDFAKNLELVENGLKKIQLLGIGIIISGIVMLIQDIIDFIKDPSWEEFFNILGDIAIIIGGIMLVMGNWWGLLIVIIGALVKLVADNWDKIKEILGKVGSWIYDNIIKPVGDFFVGLWDGIVNGVKTAVKWVKDAFSSVVSFFSNLISKIVNLFKKIGTKVGDAISGAFKAVINGVLKAIENILNFPIKSINKLINVINKVPGVNLGTLPTFKLPRLAVGGIVNMPSRGVPIGGAIAGEAGAEGVIPLTNSQAMETLGQAIGKYVTINANITNTMNGRVISRELQKVNSSSDFAFNR